MPKGIDILQIKSMAELARLRLETLRDREEILTTDELRHILKLVEAYLLHPGESRPDIPHPAGYTLHLNGYVDFPQILSMPNLAEILAFEMVKMVKKENPGLIHWVIGPALASFSIALFMAKFLGARYGVVEKDKSERLKLWERLTIYPAERVLIINDVMSSNEGSTLQTKEAVSAKNPYSVSFVQFAAVLVKHSPFKNLADGTKVLFRYKFPEIEVYEPENCPLCRIGSKPLKLKGQENRTRFLAYMRRA